MITSIRLVGQDRINAKLRAIGTVARQPLRPLLQREGRLAAISCAKATQPFGTGAAAQKAGQNRVAADIYKVYSTPSKAYSDIANPRQAAAFWAAVQRSDWDKAWAIIGKDGRDLRGIGNPITFDGAGYLHIASRDPESGRVKLKIPLALVRNPQALASYVKKMQEHVGYAKSAWTDIARQLGGVRGLRSSPLPGGPSDITANWITRNDGRGSISWQGSDASPVIVLTSNVRYGGRVLPQRDRVIAIHIARDRLFKSLAMEVRAQLRAAGLAA